MELLKVAFLYAITAIAEIVGCYLPWQVIKQGQSAWLLIPAAVCLALFAWLLALFAWLLALFAWLLALFAWLLTLHPTAAGRTCGLRRNVHCSRLGWLCWVDGVALTRGDVAGAIAALTGMAIIIALQPGNSL